MHGAQRRAAGGALWSCAGRCMRARCCLRAAAAAHLQRACRREGVAQARAGRRGLQRLCWHHDLCDALVDQLALARAREPAPRRYARASAAARVSSSADTAAVGAAAEPHATLLMLPASRLRPPAQRAAGPHLRIFLSAAPRRGSRCCCSTASGSASRWSPLQLPAQSQPLHGFSHLRDGQQPRSVAIQSWVVGGMAMAGACARRQGA